MMSPENETMIDLFAFPKSTDRENGSILALCLFFIALLSISGAGALMVASTDRIISGNYRNQSQAFCIAEAGMERSIARIRQQVTWRGDVPSDAPESMSDSLTMGSFSGTYEVTLSDTTDDGNGIYDTLIPAGYVRIASKGIFLNATQRLECLLQLKPSSGSTADSPYVAVVTEGENTVSGHHVVNGYTDDGVENTQDMVLTRTPLPQVNQDALSIFADYTLGDLTAALPGQSDFWKDPPDNTSPWIVHVRGDMVITGNINLYGIFFVEGEVTLRGAARVEGIIYAPDGTRPITLKGSGNSSDKIVTGQVLSGSGVDASGNHDNIQLSIEYVDAFNNLAGPNIDVVRVPGTWHQY